LRHPLHLPASFAREFPCLFAISQRSLSALPLSSATGQSLSLSPEAQSRIEAYLDSAETAGSSGGLLVAHNGETLISTGYGLAHRAAGHPATPETVFDMGSLTKTFTAAAIMVLQEQGALSVNDRLVTYFPDIPADKADITLHHLLTHTSGLGYGVIDGDERFKKIYANLIIY